MHALEARIGDFSPDVLRKIKAKRRSKVIKIIVFDLLLIFGVFMSRESFVGKPFEIPLFVVIGALVFFMPLIVSPTAVLFRKPWIGKIESVEVDARVRAGKRMRERYGKPPASIHLTYEVYSFYTVRDEKGRSHTVTVPGKYAHCFLVGDEVAMFAELEYPINMTEHVGGVAHCPLCSSILHYAHKEQCLHCGCRFDRRVRFETERTK